MHLIDHQEITSDFKKMWHTARQCVDKRLKAGEGVWIRNYLSSPIAEHFSFRFGNQLFFVVVEDIDRRITGPGNTAQLISLAAERGGHACLMPMRRRAFSTDWEQAENGWGLVDANTRATINPALLVTDEKTEMTDWEVHDFAVQVVRDWLNQQGFEVLSAHGDPQLFPSIRFIGASNTPEWVVVTATRYPKRHADRPINLEALTREPALAGSAGHFASVACANADQASAPDATAIPLWRGSAMVVRFDGLQQLSRE